MAISSLDIVVGAQNRTQAGLNASFASVRAWGERVSGVMQGVAQGIGQQITSTVMRAFDGVRRALEGGFRTAASLEQTEVALRTLLGTADKAKAMMGELTAFAAATPFEFPELADAAKMLVAFGVDAADVTPTLRTLGDVASGVGMSIQELTEAYGRNLVQGRLTAQDINQLTGRGIPIIRELAKQFNVAESEVRNLVSSGQVQAAHMVRAFRDMAGAGGQFAGMMEQQSKTISGLMSTLRDEVTMVMGDIANRIMEAIDARALIERLTTIVKMIGTEGFFGTLAADLVDNVTLGLLRARRTLEEWGAWVIDFFQTTWVQVGDWLVEQTVKIGSLMSRAWIEASTIFSQFTNDLGDSFVTFHLRVKESLGLITKDELDASLQYIRDMQNKEAEAAEREKKMRLDAIEAQKIAELETIKQSRDASMARIRDERNARLAAIRAERGEQIRILEDASRSRWEELLNRILRRDNEAAKPVAELSDPTGVAGGGGDRKKSAVRDMTPTQIEGLLLTGLQQAAKERYALMGNAMVNEQKTTNVTLNKIHDVLKTNKELKELVKVIDRLSLGTQTLVTR